MFIKAPPAGLPVNLLSEPRNVTNSLGEIGDKFADMFSEVNKLQLQANAKMEEFATSPGKDIHGTMIALQKADVSLRLMLQIRSKLTSAYQELTRMQL